jgi:hypothetical protein
MKQLETKFQDVRTKTSKQKSEGGGGGKTVRLESNTLVLLMKLKNMASDF